MFPGILGFSPCHGGGKAVINWGSSNPLVISMAFTGDIVWDDYEFYDAVTAQLGMYGIDESDVVGNGYEFFVNYGDLIMHFCAQQPEGGNGRFVGEMYDKSISDRGDLERMLSEMKSHDIKNEPEEWTECVRKYNYRSFCIWGDYLDKIIPSLMELADMPVEGYLLESR